MRLATPGWAGKSYDPTQRIPVSRRQINRAVAGTALILLIGWFAVPWIGPSSPEECLAVGALWLALMAAFDVGIGRFCFHLSWRRIAEDFDVRKGGLLGFGMAALLFTPLLVAGIRGLL